MLWNFSLSGNEPIVQVELVKVIFQWLPLICGISQNRFRLASDWHGTTRNYSERRSPWATVCSYLSTIYYKWLSIETIFHMMNLFLGRKTALFLILVSFNEISSFFGYRKAWTHRESVESTERSFCIPSNNWERWSQKFNQAWLQRFPWLIYSKSMDGACLLSLCFICKGM